MLLEKIKSSLPIITKDLRKKIVLGASIGAIGIATISPAMANVSPALNTTNGFSLSTHYDDYANEASKEKITKYIAAFGKQGEASLRKKFGCPIGDILKETVFQRYVKIEGHKLDRQDPDFSEIADFLTAKAAYKKTGKCEIVRQTDDYASNQEIEPENISQNIRKIPKF